MGILENCVLFRLIWVWKKNLFYASEMKKKKKSLNMNYDFLSPLVIC